MSTRNPEAADRLMHPELGDVAGYVEHLEARASRMKRDRALLLSALKFYANEKNWGPVANYANDYWYMHHRAPWRLAAETIAKVKEPPE